MASLCVLGCSAMAAPKNDDTLVRECVSAWLSEQEAARSGEEFCDDYVRTPVTELDLSPFAEALRLGHDAMSCLDVELGRPARKMTTIVELEKLFAVRSWKILEAKVIQHDEQNVVRTRREAAATVKARIESSNADGSPIVKVWTFGLFKNSGRWGIWSLYSPSSE